MNANPLPTITDERLGELKEEAQNPSLSKVYVEFGKRAKQEAEELAAELALLKVDPTGNAAAIAQTEGELKRLEGGYRRVKVRFLNLKAERTIIKILAPHAKKLLDLQGLEEKPEAMLEILGGMIGELADEAPRVVLAAFERDDITEDYLNEHSCVEELIEAVKAQLEKNSLADLLGKLLKTVAPGRK